VEKPRGGGNPLLLLAIIYAIFSLFWLSEKDFAAKSVFDGCA